MCKFVCEKNGFQNKHVTEENFCQSEHKITVDASPFDKLNKGRKKKLCAFFLCSDSFKAKVVTITAAFNILTIQFYVTVSTLKREELYW